MSAPLPSFEPPALAMAARFWSAIGRGELVLPRCSICHEWQWYPERDGTDCAGGELEWVPVASTGTLYTFTRVHRSFLPGGRDNVPYVVGMVDLDGIDGIDAPRLVATIEDSPDVHVGARVRARFVPLAARAHVVFAVDL